MATFIQQAGIGIIYRSKTESDSRQQIKNISNKVLAALIEQQHPTNCTGNAISYIWRGILRQTKKYFVNFLFIFLGGM